MNYIENVLIDVGNTPTIISKEDNTNFFSDIYVTKSSSKDDEFFMVNNEYDLLGNPIKDDSNLNEFDKNLSGILSVPKPLR